MATKGRRTTSTTLAIEGDHKQGHLSRVFDDALVDLIGWLERPAATREEIQVRLSEIGLIERNTIDFEYGGRCCEGGEVAILGLVQCPSDRTIIAAALEEGSAF